MPEVQLRTQRLLLRRMTLADVPALHTILSDPEAMRYWSTLPHDSLMISEAWVAKTIASVAAGEADDFAVLLGDTVIGKAGLWQGNEIGVILSRAHWRKGYAAEALRAIISRAFERGMDHISADIDPENAPSLGLFETLGFRRTGSAKATVLVGETWADSLYLTLAADQRADTSIGPPIGDERG